jgi:HSP20 family protein
MADRDFNLWDVLHVLNQEQRRNMKVAMQALRFQPNVDVYETAAALVVKVELAGVAPEGLSLTLSADNRALVIAGERKERREEPGDYLRGCQLEIYFGPFEREVPLPADIPIDREQISASYREGFLIIVLPKRAARRAEVHSIEVRTE